MNWVELNRDGGASRCQTIINCPAMSTLIDISWTLISFLGDEPASDGIQAYVEIIPLRKNFHPQQIKSPPAGVKIKTLPGSVLHDIRSGKTAFKNNGLIFPGNTDTKIVHSKDRIATARIDRYFYQASVGSVFNRVSHQTISDFTQRLQKGSTLSRFPGCGFPGDNYGGRTKV